ncbi:MULTISPECIES: hypothetical protein [unclassified Rhodanobacter]|uniref:hypothetical protein n=1 Tax=unclassified Rhodanobacter TaxID=2621553 RepID=UPI000AAE3D1B|nr:MULTISPECIES: hypothetical protein [unclassified Rhodanobacter]
MTDYERHLPPLHDHHDKDWSASVRMIMQGLILAGVLWLASSINNQSSAIIKLQVQVESLQMTLGDIPSLNNRVTKLESNQNELIRRQNADDARWEQLNNAKVKGWTR